MKAVIIENNLINSWDYEMILDNLDIEVQGIFKSWKKAVPVIKSDLPDFMLVDLFLDHNEKGLDFIREMKDYFIPTIICTAYPEENYMEEALDAGVVAFISKPVSIATLTYQIKRLVKDIEQKSFHTDYLVVKDKRNLIKIPFQQISKIEIDGNYSYIFLDSGKKYVLKLSLTKLTERLDPKRFVRCYRSTIVNLDFIESIDLQENIIWLHNGQSLQVGTKYRSFIKNTFATR